MKKNHRPPLSSRRGLHPVGAATGFTSLISQGSVLVSLGSASCRGGVPCPGPAVGCGDPCAAVRAGSGDGGIAGDGFAVSLGGVACSILADSSTVSRRLQAGSGGVSSLRFGGLATLSASSSSHIWASRSSTTLFSFLLGEDRKLETAAAPFCRAPSKAPRPEGGDGAESGLALALGFLPESASISAKSFLSASSARARCLAASGPCHSSLPLST
mmetsp:Transcript_3404/g.8033  ORF Transcript_3404/g.8033 Transcript_3404/m.8033 type:complete len:215 (-) Transcript_3404:244-888(-)